jgi:hypothetical protein
MVMESKAFQHSQNAREKKMRWNAVRSQWGGIYSGDGLQDETHRLGMQERTVVQDSFEMERKRETVNIPATAKPCRYNAM